MVAPGIPAVKVELAWDGATWIDVSADVRLDPGIEIHQGRTNEFETVQPGTCTFVLDNTPDVTTGIAKYTPDNPLSTYYPYIKEGVRGRVTITKSATDYQRFVGIASALNPTFPNGETNHGVLQVTLIDALGILAQWPVRSALTEVAIFQNETLGGGEEPDLWLFDEVAGSTATTLTNGRGGGFSTAGITDTARILRPKGTAYSFDKPSDLDVDGSWKPVPAPASTPATSVGPVLLMPVGTTDLTQITFWFRSSTTTPASGSYALLSFPEQQSAISLYVASGALAIGIANGATLTGMAGNDSQWHCCRIDTFTGNVTIDASTFATALAAVPASGLLVLGGNYTSTGSINSCPPGVEFGPVVVDYGSTYDYRPWVMPDQITDLGSWVFGINALATQAGAQVGLNVTGSDDRAVIRSNTAGRTPLDVYSELAASVGAVLIADVADTTPFTAFVSLTLSDSTHPTTPVATITLESDDTSESDIDWRREFSSIPTRVTVSSAVASVLVINDDAEAGTGPRSDSVSSISATEDDARNLGSAIVNQSTALRIASLTVELSTAEHDLYVALFAQLLVGQRIRVGNLPSGVFGRTYMDVYVEGYTETITAAAYRIAFDTSPADAPPDGLYDDSEFGRYSLTATIDTGTAVGNTGLGTVVVNGLAADSPLTTDPAEYPMDLDWAGERVTVSAPPASSVFPQTVTLTARGVAPTVARAHGHPEDVDVWNAARYTL